MYHLFLSLRSKPLESFVFVKIFLLLRLAARAARPSRLKKLLRARELQEQAAIAGDAFSGLQAAHYLGLAVTALAQLHRPPGKLVLPRGYIDERLILGVAQYRRVRDQQSVVDLSRNYRGRHVHIFLQSPSRVFGVDSRLQSP